jgi:hypothetical protein
MTIREKLKSGKESALLLGEIDLTAKHAKSPALTLGE